MVTVGSRFDKTVQTASIISDRLIGHQFTVVDQFTVPNHFPMEERFQ